MGLYRSVESLVVKPYFGGAGVLPMPRVLNLAICTIEKANVVVQSLLLEGRARELVAVVVDEFHLVGSSTRGVSRISSRWLEHNALPWFMD